MRFYKPESSVVPPVSGAWKLNAPGGNGALPYDVDDTLYCYCTGCHALTDCEMRGECNARFPNEVPVDYKR